MRINLQDIIRDVYESDTHIYIPSHPLLRNSIAHYTFIKDENLQQRSASLQLVPDVAGCIVMHDDGKGLMCTFWGGTTTCVCVSTKHTNIRFRFFIEFLPTGAFTFFHHNQAIYQNEKLPLDMVDAILHSQIIQAYESSETLTQFIQCLDTFFLERLQLSNRCVSSIQRGLHLGKSIQEVIDEVGYSRRHIQRMFQEQSGCTMKQYQRIERINRSIQAMQKEPMQNIHIAQTCDYYDESHFIHDFTSVMKVTPKDYREQMSIFYNETFKF